MYIYILYDKSNSGNLHLFRPIWITVGSCVLCKQTVAMSLLPYTKTRKKTEHLTKLQVHTTQPMDVPWISYLPFVAPFVSGA